MKTYKIILSILILGTTAARAALLVSNVVAYQPAGKKPVEITYDLYDTPAEGVSIIVRISTNAVDSYTLDPSTLSGDAGLGITNGNGKTITWSSVDDWGTNKYPAVKFSVIAYDGKTSADPDVVMKPVGIGIISGKVTDTLEWDLQSFTNVNNLQYSPFYCSEIEITAAQYCRFMNAYKDRFSDKGFPSCAVTSVFNNAQGGAWIDALSANQLCTIRPSPNPSENNDYSKIKWDSGSNTYQLNVTDWHTNQPMTEVSWFGSVAYCMWLNEEEFGTDTAKWKYRLPTEWEFEFMMGAKTITTTSNGTQDWGSASWTYGQCHDTISHTHNASDWANYPYDSPLGLHGVGTKPVTDQLKGYGQNATNVFGCHELSANVWEWCLDRIGASSGSVSGKDYVYRTSAPNGTVRSGAWNYGSGSWSTAYRYTPGADPSARAGALGFRVVRDR